MIGPGEGGREGGSDIGYIEKSPQKNQKYTSIVKKRGKEECFYIVLFFCMKKKIFI